MYIFNGAGHFNRRSRRAGEHFLSFHHKLDFVIDVIKIAPEANRGIPTMESALFNKINDTTLMI